MDNGAIIFIVVVVALLAFFMFKDKGKQVSVKTSASKPVESASVKNVPSAAELKKLTKNQLIDLAERENLKVKKSGSKASVITEIRNQMK